jgi:hypothetical protein
MPFNCLGDLYKAEIVDLLRKKGCDIKNVHALNLILEKMGLLIHSGNHWLTAKDAVKYTIYSSQVFDADAWHPSIVDTIYKFLKK